MSRGRFLSINLTQSDNHNKTSLASAEHQLLIRTIGVSTIIIPCTPVGINEKGFVNSNFGMFLLLDYCIENERGKVLGKVWPGFKNKYDLDIYDLR